MSEPRTPGNTTGRVIPTIRERCGATIIAMRALWLVLLAGCGRLGFDALSPDATGDGDSGAALDGFGTPDVVQAGLALDLDPGDIASYPGTGMLVHDKSPFANDGTLAGAATFTSAGAGSYFHFDGADTSFITLGTPSPAGWVFGTQPRTLSGWAYADLLRMGYNVYFSYGTGMDGRGNYLGSSNEGSTWNFGGYFINQLGGTAVAGTWLQVTGVWDGTVAHLYINGTLATEAPQPVWNATPGGDAKIGVDTEFAGEGWVGRVGRVLYYNRALAPVEVLHNFDVTRARYGL